MSRDIDLKLCLTAAALGVLTRKKLAAAFHQVNPATTFDLERAHKWLQGRAKPRDPNLYDDWARVLGLHQTGAWVAGSSVEEFIEALRVRGPLDQAALLERAEQFRGSATPPTSRPVEMAGVYACYSHAWSPYFRGRLIRGMLTIKAASGSGRLEARYDEDLPTGRLQLEGDVTVAARSLHLDLRGPNGVHLVQCLFPPTAPFSVLGGMLCGSTVIGPEAQPSVSRIINIRLPDAAGERDASEPYLPNGASMTADLAKLGLTLNEPEPTDAAFAAFLGGGAGGGFDQIPADAFRTLVGLFDQLWFARSREPSGAAA